MEDIAELFLMGFTQSLIESKNPPKMQVNQQSVSKIKNDETMQESVLKIPKEIKQKQPEQLRKIETRAIPKTMNKEKIIRIKKSEGPQTNQTFPQNNLSATEKLSKLLKDPFVKEVECLGANTLLMVQKAGMQQKTQVSLPIEDIYDIIAEFSQKTRIPIINGKIKAALNNLVITAVLSETLGPRFIIQKNFN